MKLLQVLLSTRSTEPTPPSTGSLHIGVHTLRLDIHWSSTQLFLQLQLEKTRNPSTSEPPVDEASESPTHTSISQVLRTQWTGKEASFARACDQWMASAQYQQKSWWRMHPTETSMTSLSDLPPDPFPEESPTTDHQTPSPESSENSETEEP